ncbi:MAG TPA: ribonuclease Z [Cytophagaceae bacterium]|nr:ribonuclease Z [Cytophagaceae bacterium]
MAIEVHILGSSSATPIFDRHPTAQLVRVLHHTFLVDCGEGTQMQLARYHHKASKISHVFISHLHGDHYLGLVGLLSTMNLQGRKTPLYLYGPPGLAEIITIQLKYSESRFNYAVHLQELQGDQLQTILKEEKFKVEAFPLEHRIPCYGFRFTVNKSARKLNKSKLPDNLTLLQIGALKKGLDLMDENGKVFLSNQEVTFDPLPEISYAYCSDTSYQPYLAEWLRGTNLLYHESTFTTDFEERAKETFHSTAAQAAQIAKDMQVKKLILGHFSARYKELHPLLEEARSVFPYSFLGIEGQTFIVNQS